MRFGNLRIFPEYFPIIPRIILFAAIIPKNYSGIYNSLRPTDHADPAVCLLLDLAQPRVPRYFQTV